jgi:hypothetical protein
MTSKSAVFFLRVEAAITLGTLVGPQGLDRQE